jgi:hypothetical protein
MQRPIRTLPAKVARAVVNGGKLGRKPAITLHQTARSDKARQC